MTDEKEPGRAASAMVTALHWAFDQATSNIPGLGSAEDLANAHLSRSDGAPEKAINGLIAWQVGYAGAAGFITNLGGLITMPVAIPANLASVLFIQLRMIAAIAILRGYQVSDPQVRTLVYVCLVGSGAADLLQEFSVELGRKLATGLIMKIPGKTLTKINQAVGFKLVTKAGASGLVNLTRVVPFIGGLVGGGFDAFLTRGIGTSAKLTFKAIHPDDAEDSVARSTTTTIVTSDPGPLPASE